jgi:pimeloyl-ACP methyl ester carboxylesterase
MTMHTWQKIDVAGWHQACASDPQLQEFLRAAEVTFALRSGEDIVRFAARDGALLDATLTWGQEDPDFTLAAAPDDWSKFFRPVPPPAYQSFFGMRMRVPSAEVEGNELAMIQHAHITRRVLELGRVTANGGTSGEPQPAPHQAAASKASIRSGYVQIETDAGPLDIFYESAGQGQDVLLLHTAGADGRQYHDLMTDPSLTSRCRLITFDLPGHGRSDMIPGAPLGSYSLTTDYYASTIFAVIAALKLDSPIVSGSSMGGEICLEAAFRAQGRLRGVIACSASDQVPGRKVSWARHPQVDEMVFVPEWVYGLMSPTSPERYRQKVWWGYSQGGFNTFKGDIDFYSGDWDGRDRVGNIDTRDCPVLMMTGEYDYSCTPAMSEATASRIPGATFWEMTGLGHFPMAENPPLFAEYFTKALNHLGV